MRYVPLLCFVVFCVFGILGRPVLHARRYGVSGIMLFRSGRRGQAYWDALTVILFLCLAGQAVAVAIRSEALSSITIDWLGRAGRLRYTGAAVIALATIGLALAQGTLGASWRIGIDEAARPGLVTGGMYRFCRNPIFLFLAMTALGFALLVPTWISLAALAGTCVGVRRQVREEEAYLLRTYDDDYRAYARRVGRFVPFVGRLD